MSRYMLHPFPLPPPTLRHQTLLHHHHSLNEVRQREMVGEGGEEREMRSGSHGTRTHVVHGSPLTSFMVSTES